MKKYRKFIWIFTLGFGLYSSCVYEPTDIYFNPTNQDVEPPQIQVIQLTLDDENDTIYADAGKAIEFQFNSYPQEIQAVEFIVDEIYSQIFYSNKGCYYLNKWFFYYRTHSLKINIYTSSGTGSIADKIGGEMFVFSKEWTVFINNYF